MSTLIIPIHLDALYLKAPKEVIGAKADFSRLPYFNKEKKIDVNSDIANISENVLSQPFQSHSLQLEAGFHLHWALPDLLTAGKLEKNDKGEKLVYPNVPDRWLITRINGKNQKQWVVESNFLQKEGSNNMEDGISFPLSDHERGSSGQPFRYMGRQIDLSEKDTLEGTHQYYGNLTALGYGDPSFGAFYPECHSVFGCHDPLNETLAGTIEYEVIGWYNRPEQDYFAQTLIEINNSKEVSSLKGGEKTTAIAEALLNNLNISAELSDNLPTNLLCYGRLILEDGILKNTQDTLPTIEKIAIGNTATEALSALLNDKDINKEKQLEAIRLMSKIGTQRLDLNAKFEEAFHDNGFSPIDGGSVWTITMRKTSDKKDQNTPAQFDANLPELFAHHLNILNNFQQQFDRATDELRDLKQQLFSDWYKFMVSGNHPYIHKDELSDPDEIRFFIENNSIVELKKKSDQREKLLSQDNHKGEIWKASEQVKKDNDNFNTGRIPKHKQGRNFNNNELFFTADESKGSTLGLHLNGDIQEISFETFQNEAVEVRAPNAAIFIKLNEMHHELADDALALTNLQAGLKQAYLNQADLNQVLFDLNQVMADLKQSKAISLWVKINSLNSSENFNLIHIENEDHSEIGPAGIGSFWKSVYIDGQKMDPYTLHKWLEIPKDQWIHIYLEAGESFIDPIILTENFSAGGSFASIVSIASIEVMKQTLTADGRAHDRNKVIEIKGPNAAVFITLNDMPEKLPDDALAFANLQADLKQACLNQALVDLKQAKAISLWVKINGLNSSEDFNLIRIENEDHSEIGPTGIGSFWKSMYIDGQKMDPYTLHKWLEIPKDQWIHIYLEAGESFADPIILMENFSAEGGGSFDSIASIASIRVMKQTLTEDERACDRNIFRQREYKLEKGAAPRYWQANEPVIMMSGPACEPSQRHGFDGKDQEDNKLKCYISELDSIPNESTIKVLVDNQDLKSFYNEHFDKYLKWTAQPWNPIMLDWEVEIFPLQKNDENDIINHFTLQDHHPDLTLTSANNHFEESGVIFSGNTLLSPHAKIKVLDAINNYLENPNHKKSAVADSINAQKEQIEKGHFLSQAFSGFNAAMLMHKQTMQLPIDDPLAFEDYSDFSQKIKELVGNENKWAPMPENPFSPIRAGKIRVLNLRLIDSFGRHVDAPVEKNTIHSHAFPTAEDMAVMLPRITQPTRLNLRWISANRDELEMNSHPESSPICGWILPNNLDNSMMIYDQSGDLLGLIDQKGIWKEGPGNQNKISINHIPNKHLRQVVLSLEKDSADFLKIANKTLEKIDPESFAQHLDLALLMGRPIAIVRASLNLELKGRTAVNQSWDLFTKDIEDETYDTEGFEKVRFPIRLGEPGQFNDGVIGFWKDEETKGPFHATISVKDMNTKEDFENEEDRDFDEEPDRIENSDTSKDTETIHYYKNGKPNIAVSIADAPQTFTMLIDPRAKVHVVSGIQPTKVINLPPDQYMDALRRIDIFFMASPILCPKGRIALPLPIEPGFEWSWISKQKTTWSEITKTGRIDKHKVLDAFPNGQNLWDDLVLQKWIDPLDGFTANIVTKNERKSKTLSTSTAPMTDKIEFMLNQCMIIPPDYAASFKDKSDIREGWLKLSHNTKNRL
jgi:hypothetical protein